MSTLERKFEELTSKQVFVWLVLILVIALVVGVIVLALYFLNFNSQISQRQEIWGAFGDYIGGLLNPAFSFLALIALLMTIILQSKELETTRKELQRTADASAAQVEYFASQQKREDIYKLITKLSDRINNNYNKNHLQNGGSIHRALHGEKDTDKNKFLRQLHNEAQDINTSTYRIIKHIENDLLRLQELLDEYDKVSTNTTGPTPFPAFYRSEYCEMVAVFHQLKLIRVDLYEYFCQNFTTDT